MRPVLDEVGTERAASFDASHAERLRNRLMRRYAANSARGQLSALASVFAWAMKKRLLASNPFVDVKKPKKESRIEYLTSEDARKLLTVADEQGGSESTLRGAGDCAATGTPFDCERERSSDCAGKMSICSVVC
ncbi:MAG: hypothetical protein U0745_17735 [Polyangia bacterium]